MTQGARRVEKDVHRSANVLGMLKAAREKRNRVTSEAPIPTIPFAVRRQGFTRAKGGSLSRRE